MSIKKEDVLNNLEEVKQYILEAEQKKEEKVLGLAIKTRFGSVIFQSTKTTYKEAVKEALESGANLSCANLSDANLSGSDLSDANLSDANLSGSDLSGANLSGAYLSGSDLSDANLSDADLSGANLSGANLSGADLRGAELNCAKFYGRGGSIVIKKRNLEGFLGALGFKLED